MKKIESLRQLQIANIYILRDTLKFCKDNDIMVYLFGGTLIGAIRHKGFIPWDDDIDLAMSRTQYNKLISKAKDGWISDKCRILDPSCDSKMKGYIPYIAYDRSVLRSGQFKDNEASKISLSIFVFDGAPNPGLFRKWYYTRVYMLRAQHALCRANFKNSNTKIARIVGPILSPFYKASSVYKYKAKVLKHAQKYDYSKSSYCGCGTDAHAGKEVFPVKEFQNSVEVCFEGLKAYTFGCYKEYLTNYYGDYMSFPPEEARKPKHSAYAEIDDDFDFSCISIK